MTPRKVKAETRIARALRDLDLDELKQETTKTDSILIRVTEAEKAEIKAVAETLDMAVSEYLLAIHREVARIEA